MSLGKKYAECSVRYRTEVLAKKRDNCAMSAKIVNLDQMNNGVVVTFTDGTIFFFDAAFLYNQRDKRLDLPLEKRVE